MSLSDLIAPGVAALSLTYTAMNGASAIITRQATTDPAEVFEVSHLHIESARLGEPVAMQVDRKIKRPFMAEWSVTVRTVTPDGLVQHCAASSPPVEYLPEARLPANLTLDWWTAGQCPPLPVGQHMATTIWRIVGPFAAPVKVVSNVFEVTE